MVDAFKNVLTPGLRRRSDLIGGDEPTLRPAMTGRAKYAATAFIGSLVVSIYLAWIARWAIDDTVREPLSMTHQLAPLAVVIIGTAVATLAAWHVYPIGNRSVVHMARKGAAVVAITTMLGPLLIMPLSLLTPEAEFGTVYKVAEFWFLSMVAAHLLSLLAIWPIGIFLSFIHADPS